LNFLVSAIYNPITQTCDIFENRDLKILKTLNFLNENNNNKNFEEILKFKIKEISQNSLLGIFMDDNSIKIFDEKKIRRNFKAK